jgi:hypothetical protein
MRFEIEPSRAAMTTETKEKPWDSKTERRKSRRPRRRLVDLTLTRGTDRREKKEDRRKATLDETAERLDEKEEEQG